MRSRTRFRVFAMYFSLQKNLNDDKNLVWIINMNIFHIFQLSFQFTFISPLFIEVKFFRALFFETMNCLRCVVYFSLSMCPEYWVPVEIKIFYGISAQFALANEHIAIHTSFSVRRFRINWYRLTTTHYRHQHSFILLIRTHSESDEHLFAFGSFVCPKKDRLHCNCSTLCMHPCFWLFSHHFFFILSHRHFSATIFFKFFSFFCHLSSPFWLFYPSLFISLPFSLSSHLVVQHLFTIQYTINGE